MKSKNFDFKNKVLIVAEIGNNHEGSFSLAKKLIEKAAKAGVDAVKFQTFKTEKFVNDTDQLKYKRYKKFELTKGWLAKKLSSSEDHADKLISILEERSIWQRYGF